MAWLLIFLSFLISISTKAQLISLTEAEAYADELVKRGFLTAKGKSILLDEAQKGNIEIDHPSTVNEITYTSSKLSKQTILQFCYFAMIEELRNRLHDDKMSVEEKINPKEPLDDSLARTYNPFEHMQRMERSLKGCIGPEISVMGFTRMKTLAIFKESGLIDDKIFQRCKEALRAKKLMDEVELLSHMVQLSIYYRYYEFNKGEQEEYIRFLAKQGLLTEEGKDSLINSYKDFELKQIHEILQASPRFLFLDLHQYEANPFVTYPVIFNAIRQLLPAFEYDSLQVSIVESKMSDLIQQEVQLEFKVGALPYRGRFFHNYRREKPSPTDVKLEIARVDDDFHKVVNKWLTDVGSPFRLCTINVLDEDERYYGQRSVGLLLLKEGEDTLISTNPYIISKETFDPGFSKINILKTLKEFTENGFFSHLTSAEIDSANTLIARDEINSIEILLSKFPKTLVIFDWETGNLENPYEQITKEFVAASRGAFNISDITDEFKKGWEKAKRVKYGFTMNGKRYEKMLKFDGDWIDPEFLALLKSAILDHKVGGYIYSLGDSYIYLSFDQFKFLQEVHPGVIKGD